MRFQYLPHDTADALTQQRLNDCRNLGLILGRFNPWTSVNNQWSLTFRIERTRGGRWEPRITKGEEAKGYWLSDLRDDRRIRLKDEPLLRYPRIAPDLLTAHYARWQALVRAQNAERFELRAETRLVVGLGMESVLETAIMLHRIYGYPIIPGSALKGLARSLALLELATKLGVPALTLLEYWRRKPPGEKPCDKTPLNKLENLLEAEDKEWAKLLPSVQVDPAVKQAKGAILGLNVQQIQERQDIRDFREAFGYLSKAGGAVFFDGVPKEAPKLVSDLMNAHYPQYYQAQGFPHDADSPRPVSFLAIEAGATFSFAVGPRRKDHQVDVRAACNVRQWLERALREIGVGAKTGAGYGVFGEGQPARLGKADPEPTPPPPSTDAPRSKPTERTQREEEISEFAKEVARFLGIEE